MLHKIVWPAQRLSRSLCFSRKFILIFLLAVVPSLILLAIDIHDDYQNILRDKAELVGIQEIEALSPLFAPAALHRGLTGRALTGDTSIVADISKASARVDELVQKLAIDIPSTYPSLTESASRLVGKWQAAKAWQGKPPSKNFDAHNDFILEAIELLHAQGAKSGLLLDPDASAYFQIITVVDQLPQLRELIAQSRGCIAQIDIGSDSIGLLLGRTNASLHRATLIAQRVERDLAELGEHSPTIARQAGSQWQAINTIVHEVHTSFAMAIKDPGKIATDKAAYFKQFTTVLDNMDKFQDMQLSILRDDILGHRLANGWRFILLKATLSLGVILLISWLVAGFALDITNRVVALKTGASLFGRGDFSVRLEIQGTDELSSVAQGLNGMAEDLSEVLNAVQNDATELLRASESIGIGSAQVAQSSEEQAAAAEAMASAIEQLTVSISQISERAREANNLAEQAGLAANNGGQVIGDTVTRVRNISTTVDGASDSVTLLGTHATQIAGIVGVIREIADQTNLLALNAAIEAARAGETGRGFAVVADEVRKLAERTSASTRQISDMIASILHGSKSAVDNMTRGVAEVHAGVGLAEQAGHAITAIKRTSVQVVDVATAISLSLREQSATTSDVAGRVENIARMSEENSSAAASSAGVAEQLRGMAVGLSERVATFKFAD